MHSLFADWYKAVNPSPELAVLERRWAATEELVKSLTAAEAVEFSTFVWRAKATVPLRLASTHKTHDAAMPTRKIDAELRVLAAVALRVSIESGPADIQLTSALALLCGAFGAKEKRLWLDEHLGEATTRIAMLAQSKRGVVAFRLTSPPTLDLLGAGLAKAQASVDALSEQVECLWWAHSRFSRLLVQPYGALGIAMPLVAAVEFANLLRTRPATPELETLLVEVVDQVTGEAGRSISLANSLGALGRDSAAKVAAPVPETARTLCPLISSIAAMGQGKFSAAALDRDFGIKGTTALSAMSLSLQCLRETQLIASISTSAKA
jgi:hypothetical protein